MVVAFSKRRARRPLTERPRAQFDLIFCIQVEHPDGDPADRRKSGEEAAVLSKVIAPNIAPGMKEAADLAAIRVNAGEIRAFLQIAVRAGEREIVLARDAAVLPGND